MPVITIKFDELRKLGIELSNEEIIETLPMLGCDIEDYDDNVLKVEFFPNRPDNFSVEGISRSLKGFLGMELGIPKYTIKDSGFKVFVDEKISKIRPFIAVCIVKNLEFNEDKVKQIMEFQEDLHWVMGRDRKKVAIGLHNYDVVTPPFYYKAADPDNVAFVPLNSQKKMTLREILNKHETGRKYAHLLKQYKKYPLILDDDDNVLSMPPIINAELTKIDENTKNVLIDVTGTDFKAVMQTVNILSTSFAESGGKIETVEIIYPDKKVKTPDLTPKTKLLNVENVKKIIGHDISLDEIKHSLLKARMDVEEISDDKLKVYIPAYRVDILHEVDIIENVAIQYRFNNIKPRLPKVATVGEEDPWYISDNVLRKIMVGLGFQEIMSLMLTNEDTHYKKMRLKEDDRVQVSQPISEDRTMIRKSLLGNLMEFLRDNRHAELPQKIFEVGEAVYIDKKSETKVKSVKKLAGAVMHSNTNFTEIKSIVATIIKNLGYKMELEKTNHPSFIKGRVAKVRAKMKDKASIDGVFGEIHPEVIINFDLEYPVTAFELEFTHQQP